MKVKFFLFSAVLISILYPLFNYANPEYKEVSTSVGKVIIGLNKEEALERFGSPLSATEELWYYSAPQEFFVCFPTNSILSIHLYPQLCEISVGIPLEFRVSAYFSNFAIKDITSSVQLVINEPQDFILEKPGIIIPKKAGEYQILAKYSNIFSNPSYLTVRAPQEKKITEKEQLLSINILPYKPKVPPKSRLDFVALGTFFDSSKNSYFVRDISEDAIWLTQQYGRIINEKDRQVYFASLGKVKVFSKFKNLESYPQEVEVKDISLPLGQRLKHITLLPEFILTPTVNIINLKAFGTYNNNRVEDITSMVNWQIKDKEVLVMQEKGKFLSKSEGVTEVNAELDDLESLSTKIIVISAEKTRKGSPLQPNELYKTKEEKGDYEDLTRDMKDSLESVRKSFIGEGKRPIRIKIIPDYLRIPLGEKEEFSAFGVYSDNSEEDLTLLSEWLSSDNRIATVSRGNISTLSMGEVKISVKFQGPESIPALVIVEEPKLVSIILSPQNSQILMKDKLNLKAEGYFSDTSRKDITSLVNWKITNPRIIKIEKGRVRALRFGETQVSAGYSGIKSLPANIKVIFTWQWLIGMFFTGISFLILCLIIVFFILYFVTKQEKNKLLALYKNPREFIISLYENAKRILIIFGLKYEGFLVPLTFAELIEKRYSIENNLFLRFTVKFEEAKYSSHILQREDTRLVLNDYNNFLKVLFVKHNNFFLILRYCLTLLHRMPLSIYKGDTIC